MSNEQAAATLRGLVDHRRAHNLGSGDIEALTMAAEAMDRLDGLELVADMERRRFARLAETHPPADSWYLEDHTKLMGPRLSEKELWQRAAEEELIERQEDAKARELGDEA